jgi:hypothetical protein
MRKIALMGMLAAAFVHTNSGHQAGAAAHTQTNHSEGTHKGGCPIARRTS